MHEYPKYVVSAYTTQHCSNKPEFIGTRTFNSWSDAETWCVIFR